MYFMKSFVVLHDLSRRNRLFKKELLSGTDYHSVTLQAEWTN